MNNKKVALVTGGSSGIGLATSKRLSKEGYLVVIASRNKERAKKALSQIENGVYIQVDVRNELSVKNLIKKIIFKFGKIDVVINNAGVLYPRHEDITILKESDYDNMMDTNFKGIYLVTKYSISSLIKSSGSIVNMGSRLGLVPKTYCPIYCAAKAAVINFTKAMAIKYAKDQVRINCVCPGPTNTPLWRRLWDSEEKMLNYFEETIPIGRMATPEEIANIVCYLVSSEASYVTGGIWTVDGGQSAV